MKYSFTKMHGTGNDYIYIDCMENTLNNPEKLARILSDRHFSVGGDGLVLIMPSDKAVAAMRMFNSDGSEGIICGNALRCVAKYLYDNGYTKEEIFFIETAAGIREVNVILSNKIVSGVWVNMGTVSLSPKKIGMNYIGERFVNEIISIGNSEIKATCVSVGNPHCIIFTDKTNKSSGYGINGGFDIEKHGVIIEKHPLFKNGVNVEAVEIITPSHIKMRVWERGSGITLACGSGAVAAVYAACTNGLIDKSMPVKVTVDGGELWVEIENDGNVWLYGNAVHSFDGVVWVDGVHNF